MTEAVLTVPSPCWEEGLSQVGRWDHPGARWGVVK